MEKQHGKKMEQLIFEVFKIGLYMGHKKIIVIYNTVRVFKGVLL